MAPLVKLGMAERVAGPDMSQVVTIYNSPFHKLTMIGMKNGDVWHTADNDLTWQPVVMHTIPDDAILRSRGAWSVDVNTA